MTHGVPQDTHAPAASDAPAGPVFSAPYAPPDEQVAAELLGEARRPAAAEARIDAAATRLIEGIRARAGGLGGIEDFLHAYSLSTKEGLALMVLAEALLRVPDAATADRLIEDKLAAGDWSAQEVKSNALLVSASAWTLGITARIIQPGETPDGIVDSLVKRLGVPAVRAATRQAMRLLGSHFVLGQTIEEALQRAARHPDRRYSFDMLGEGARTAADAGRHFAAYARAIDAIGASAGEGALPDRPGISVKLSALHPRFEAVSRDRVMAELVPRVLELARLARDFDLNFTVDAEEADRLELSLEVIAAVLADPSLRGWEGFGLAVQAYQKRAPAVIDWLAETGRALGRRLMVRLVKGAYWDTEVKRAQERGLADYPVFTRKPMTDLCFAVCAQKLLSARPILYPQFATHNALTVASVIEDAGGVAGYEFQRLHGMGEVLYDLLLAEQPNAAVRVYAPVGGHRDLLAYLVRRLLENGANSSFVSVAADPAVPIATILRRPQSWIGDVAACTPSENSLAARPLWPIAAEFGRRRIRRPGEPRRAARGRSRRHGAHAGGAADRRDRASRRRARGRVADRRQSDRQRARRRRCGRGGRHGGGSGRLCPLERDRRSKSAPWRSNARAICSKRGAAGYRAVAVRRRQDARRRGRRGARSGRLLPLLRGRSAALAATRVDARTDRRVERAFAIAAAGSSSASVHGIFRWRSSSAR